MAVLTVQPLQKMPITALKGVGKAIADKLAKLSIFSIQDILFHLPMRYQDRTRIIPIRNLREGDYALIEGEVVTNQIKFGKRRHLLVTLQDGNSFMQLRFFHFNKAQQDQLAIGVRVQCFGEAHFWTGGCAMVHPEYRVVNDVNIISDVDQHLTPIYPTTEGLHQTMWRKLTQQALMYACGEGFLDDLLPKDILEKYSFVSLSDALWYVHRPPPDADQNLLLEGKHPAQRRLAFEELLAHQLSIEKLRQAWQQHAAPALPVQDNEKFLQNLPFTLTNAQQKAIQEISHDLTLSVPMSRLVQGDVGSGKTIVAALAALQAIINGYQVAIMAPTEILAEQHYQNFSAWFESLNIKTTWLVGSLTSAQKRSATEDIALGLAQIIIGTHALFQEAITFKKLGLIIIDEQHRFGVQQRLALREKGRHEQYYPHQLIMTATPIPRTLVMTSYADLDISIIDELPPGRTPVQTAVLSESKRGQILSKVSELCEQGGQVYWVCALIEESETLQCQAAENTAVALQEALPNVKVGLLHGRMKPQEKELIMQQFTNNELQLLVATTVIEVGVNVPNASLMVIENAERLGLAQLHQLRGRVGRGAKQSHCILLYKAPLSDIAKERLEVIRSTTDGFKIAEQDLRIRGPGDVLGTRQTGYQQFRIADIMRDSDLLLYMKQHVELMHTKYPEKVDKLIYRWIGDRDRYIYS